MKRARTVIAGVLVLGALALPAPAADRLPAEIDSAPGQIQVLTINTRQLYAPDTSAFRRIKGVVDAIRSRPASFEGGRADATAMPDVIIIQEMRLSNVDIFRRILNQNSRYTYEVARAEGSMIKFLYNSSSVTLIGSPLFWVDTCRPVPPEAGEHKRFQFARFVETETQLPFVVAGLHLKARYEETNQPGCRERNVELIRQLFAAESAPVIVGGDFNQRATVQQKECDPNERSEPMAWWSLMTDPSAPGRSFVDSVRDWHRSTRDSMKDEWTFERSTSTTLCDGTEGYKRSRLDYLFASGAEVADAHADHPGWAGKVPGEPGPHHKYSDHRWVAARFIIDAPVRPGPVTATPLRGGAVDLSWPAGEAVSEWVVYRRRIGHKYNRLVRIPGTESTYRDESATSGVTYRYAVAAVGENGAQSRESLGAAVSPDARGPFVKRATPGVGARQVEPRRRIEVWLDEPADPDSIDGDTVTVSMEGRALVGRLFMESRRHLVLTLRHTLPKGATFGVLVRPVSDLLGNRGESFWWRFTTELPRRRNI